MTLHTYQYIWHVPNHGAPVNIKYKHADSKATYLISLGWCSEIILMKVRFCHLKSKPTYVSSWQIIYIGRLLKVSKGYISIIMFLLKIKKSYFIWLRLYIKKLIELFESFCAFLPFVFTFLIFFSLSVFTPLFFTFLVFLYLYLLYCILILFTGIPNCFSLSLFTLNFVHMYS